MGFYKDNTVEVTLNGKSYRVSKETKESLEKSGKLDTQKKKTKIAKKK